MTTTTLVATDTRLKLIFHDYWRLGFAITDLPISDGPVQMSLTAVSPNGYHGHTSLAATVSQGATEVDSGSIHCWTTASGWGRPKAAGVRNPHEDGIAGGSWASMFLRRGLSGRKCHP